MRRPVRILLAAAAAAMLLAAAPARAQDDGGATRDEPRAEAAARGGEAGDDALARNRGARYDPRQEPAEGAAYQYRQMALALVVMAGMISLLVWLVRRQSRKRG